MICIRQARIDDADGIAQVVVSAWQDTYRGLLLDANLDNLSVEERTQRWRKRLVDVNDPYHRIWVAESNGHVIGFASYGPSLEDDPNYREEIYALYLLKEFRGQDIGTELVKRSAAALMNLNITSMIIWVLSGNPYQKFYERLGGKYLWEKLSMVRGVMMNKTAYGWAYLGLFLKT